MRKGQNLEHQINIVNLGYRQKKKAFIQKIDVPIRVTASGLKASLSTVDYRGIVAPNGKGIAFDAKECGSITSFPLDCIRQHQLEFLSLFGEMGGVAFFLIWFYNIDKEYAYKIPIEFIEEKWNEAAEGGRKSIPIKELRDGWKVKIENYLNL